MSKNRKRELADERLRDPQFRREMVHLLWLRGNGRKSIADQLGIGEATAQRDIEIIRAQIQRDNAASLQTRIDRSLAVRRKVQDEAWRTYDAAMPGSKTRVESLQVVLAAQDKIDEIEGVVAPDKVSSAALAEIQQAFLSYLLKRGGPDEVRAFLLEVRAAAPSVAIAMLAGGKTSEDDEAGEDAPIVEADTNCGDGDEMK